MEVNVIHNEDCLAGLKKLPDECVDCIVTSPPYYGLRDYKHPDQLGLEATPDLYVVKMTEIFRECKRVLKKQGTLWLNLGDSYAGSWGNYGGQNRGAGKQRAIVSGSKVKNESWNERTKFIPHQANGFEGIKPKDLIGIPWMMAFALRADGWWLRQDIIWSKKNCLPESVTDRCTKSHEYIFLLSKSDRYYFDQDAIKEPVADSSVKRISQPNLENQKGSDRVPGKTNGNFKAVLKKSGNKARKDFSERGGPEDGNGNVQGSVPWEGYERNKRSVWEVTTKPFSEAHFATFPQDLIDDCIKAGCPKDGVVLDPFMGAGTTAIVARKLGRNYIGFEINPDYIKIAEKRLYNELGMFK